MAGTQRRSEQPFFVEQMLTADVCEGGGEAVHGCSLPLDSTNAASEKITVPGIHPHELLYEFSRKGQVFIVQVILRRGTIKFGFRGLIYKP